MLNRFENFIIDITEIDLYWHRLATAEMKRYGLKGSYAIYFPMLHHSPDGLTGAELAAMCGKDKADISRDIAVLEKAGLVTRERVSGNGYRARITLTPSGTALTQEVIQKAELAVGCIGGSLSEADRECFYRVLDTITSNLQALSETGLPETNTKNETKET